MPSPLDLGRDTLRVATDPFVTASPSGEAPLRAARLATRKRAAKRRKAKRPPVCTTKDLATKRSKRRRCRVVKRTVSAAARRPSPTGPVAAPPATAPHPDAFPVAPAAVSAADSSTNATLALPTYAGSFGVAEATRLMFRAGFGPLPGQAQALASAGLRAAVSWLMNPGAARLEGPAPSGSFLVGGQFAPQDRYGHLHLATLDRQVRSTDQLGERMTLVLHDWFAVAEGNADRRLIPAHLELLRSGWRGSFRQLLLNVTQDPAMLQYLDGSDNRKGSPNENYGRELMELYTLGADRGAYTEDDVREIARALTGFRNDWTDGIGAHDFRYDPLRHDTGTKTLFAGTRNQRSGTLTWQDAIHAVVDHWLHPSFVVRKLWSYFIPTEPPGTTQGQLEVLYRKSGEQLAPVVEAILMHPDLHQGPAMVKSPLTFTAGLLRATGQGISTDLWTWRMDAAGQRNGNPPSVAGWNDKAWLNTSTHSARWGVVQEITVGRRLGAADYVGKTETPAEALAKALAFLGNPVVSPDLMAAARRVAEQTWAPRTPGDQYGLLEIFLAQRQNVLRQMIAASPDFQVA